MKNFGTERGTRVSRERTLVAIPPRAVIGLEAEFNLFVNGRRRRPEKVFGDPSRLVRRRMIRRTGKSFQSPAGGATSIHAWGTAANIYRVGDTFLNDVRSIGKYGAIAASLSPAVFVRPFGLERGQTNDHLHIDLGFASLTPRECSDAS